MNICTCCGGRLGEARATWTTCEACQTRITGWLAELGELWPQLTDCLEPQRGHSGPRVSGTKDWRLPVAEEILDLIGPFGVPTQLYMLYADLALARGLAPRPAASGADSRMSQALRGIRRHLSWAVQAVDLRPLHTELGRLCDQLERTTGGADRHPTIPCPAELPDDAGRCTGRMRYDSRQRTAFCRACGTRLDPHEWLGYWMKLGQPAAT
ncbi:hypothetical protein ACWGOK_40830 [Streptomyces eurythermus]